MKHVAPDTGSAPAAVHHAPGPLTLPQVWQRVKARVLPFRSPLAVIVPVGLVAAGQLVEDSLDSPPLQMLSANFSVGRWTVVVAVLYMVVILKVLEGTVQRSLAALQPVVKIDARAFHAYAARMNPPGPRVGILLLVVSAVVVAVLVPLTGGSLPTVRDPVTDQSIFLSADPLLALIELAGYTMVSWAGNRLVYSTIRLGVALGRLAREPLDVNVFDTTGLLPFGRIALVVALAPGGVVAILLFGLGQPTGAGSWLALTLATLASISGLLLPLRGVHRQMGKAKQAHLRNLNRDIAQVYGDLDIPSSSDAAELARLTNRTSTLVALRKVVGEMTTWPFQDTVALGRALLIASAPLIYTALNELIKLFVITPLGPTK
jgi:hypothetical protein